MKEEEEEPQEREKREKIKLNSLEIIIRNKKIQKRKLKGDCFNYIKSQNNFHEASFMNPVT